jgi:hypothetical protein
MFIFNSKLLIKILSFDTASAMALFPVILVRHKHLKHNPVLINHEKIHLRQQLEMLIVPFYVWYLSEFLIKFIRYGNRTRAYKNISFEKEAYANENDLNYLQKRPFWHFVKYLV